MQECRSLLYKYLYEKLQVMKTIVVLVDGIFYWVNEAENADKTNFFRYYEKKLGVYKGAALQDLESKFLENFSGGIDSIVKSSLASTSDEKKKKLLEKQESLLSLSDNAYLAERVRREMIPIFQRKSYQKKNCSKDVSKTPYKDSLMEKRFQDCKKQDVLSDLSGIIYSLFGNGPMMLYKGMRYTLARGDFPKRKNMFFYVDGAIYNLVDKGEEFDIEKIDEAYHSKIREKITSKMLNGDRTFAKQLENMSNEILDILSKKKYIDPGKKVGFIITSKGFHALAVVEDSYIFYDPHNKQYYGFGPKFGKKPAAIVSRLEIDGMDIKIQKPRVLNSYKHPSLYSDSEYQEICTKPGYTPPEEVPIAKFPSKIAEILTETIHIFTEGYSGESEHKKLYRDNPYWAGHLLSRSQVNQTMVTNGLFVGQGA